MKKERGLVYSEQRNKETEGINMAKTITIPGDVTRMEITLNGKTYVYAGGATVSVPDEVAALIAANEANLPDTFGTRPVNAPLAAENKKGSRAGVPVLTDELGNLYADSEGVAKAALSKIYVDGHMAVVPDGEG